MTKHTPGPWRVIEEDGDGKCQHTDKCKTWVLDSEERGNMALMQAWYSGNDPDVFEEVRANARLIAAAPDLLDVLEKVTDPYRSLPDEVLEEVAPDWLAEAFAAVTKAKGESDG